MAAELTELDKVEALTVLTVDERATIAEGMRYASVPYMPLTKEFLSVFVLNNGEYPILEGKLSQAATEVNVRFQSLVEAHYERRKTELDAREWEIRLEEIPREDLGEAREMLELERASLERRVRVFRLRGHDKRIRELFSEFSAWKQTADELFEAVKQYGSADTPADVDYRSIRVAEMSVKTQRWQEAAAAGEKLEGTPMHLASDPRAVEFSRTTIALPEPPKDVLR